MMQVLLIIYKPEKECVLHPGFPSNKSPK